MFRRKQTKKRILKVEESQVEGFRKSREDEEANGNNNAKFRKIGRDKNGNN